MNSVLYEPLRSYDEAHLLVSYGRAVTQRQLNCCRNSDPEVLQREHTSLQRHQPSAGLAGPPYKEAPDWIR